jgi:glycosyltransferase involved in cell wall biosynthesis
VANYRQGKGLTELVELARNVCRERPNARFVLVGDGPLRPTLAEAIARLHLTDHVTLHGRAADVGPLFGAFDILVQASESEGMPNALLEGAAAGLPIAATAAGGTTELVVHGESGMLVQVGDYSGLGHVLIALIDDEGLRRRLGQNVQRKVNADFSAPAFIERTARLYRQSVRPRADS